MSDGKEKLIVFHADLDNTLIYSWKHEIGEEKTCVEVYEGRELSFMTGQSSSLLKKVRKKTLFVPVTTRTREQYERIRLGTGIPEYALVCNGGVLLKDGKELTDWYEESLRLTEKSRREFGRAGSCMQEDCSRILEVRNIRNLFLFTKSREPDRMVKHLKDRLDPALMDVFSNGSKVYALPKGLDKGTAVRRFKGYIKADLVLAAGDSEFDLPMLQTADRSWAPEGLVKRHLSGTRVTGVPDGRVFSDVLLEGVCREVFERGIGRTLLKEK